MYKHLFGPVPSRRLGMSLGIDLVPHKVCSFDCIYCECGATTNRTVERAEYISYDDIIKEIQSFFKENEYPDYVTFSGAGEPTLNIHIGAIIDYLKQNHPKVPIAVLTNGSLLYDEQVRKELMQADLVLPSLDAAINNSYKRINRPHPDLEIKKYTEGLTQFGKEYSGTIWLEVLIIPGFNDDLENLRAVKNIILDMNPDKVQLNTLDRPGVIDNIVPASQAALKSIIELWNLDNVEIIAKSSARKENKSFRKDTENAIFETIVRRPCTIEDLSEILGLHMNEINKYLDVLEADGKLIAKRQERGVFYQAKAE